MTFSSVRCVKKNFITETSWTHFTCKWFISLWWIDLSFPGFKRMIQWVMSEMSDHSSLISLMSDDEWRMIELSELSEMSEMSDEWRMSGEWVKWVMMSGEWVKWVNWVKWVMSDEWSISFSLMISLITHLSISLTNCPCLLQWKIIDSLCNLFSPFFKLKWINFFKWLEKMKQFS